MLSNMPEDKLLIVLSSPRSALLPSFASAYWAGDRKIQQQLGFQKKQQTHGEHHCWSLFIFLFYFQLESVIKPDSHTGSGLGTEC